LDRRDVGRAVVRDDARWQQLVRFQGVAIEQSRHSSGEEIRPGVAFAGLLVD
jgi:hypothetical protein